MRTISRYFDLTEAQVARAALRAGEVDELLRDEYLGSLDWTYLIALGGLRLQVEEPTEPAAMLSREFAIAEECPELRDYEAPDLALVRVKKLLVIALWISPALIPLVVARLLGVL